MALAIGAATLVFYPAFLALLERWQEPLSYFDHGIFVPFVCLWMAWREYSTQNKTDLSMESGTNPYLGLSLALLGLVFQLIGSAQQVTFLQGAAIVITVWAVVLLFVGKRVFGLYRWPLLYLLLLIPIPTFFMAQLTLGMRELSTSLASGTLHGVMAILGQPYARVGNVLSFAGNQVTIVDACSGMNTLITVIAIGMILVYLETSRLKSWITVALLIPTAILANLIRILVICFFVAIGQGVFAFGSGHAAIGVSTVGAALAVLAFGIHPPKKWEERWGQKSSNPLNEKQEPASSENELVSRSLGLPLSIFTASLIGAAILSVQIQKRTSFAQASPQQQLPNLNLAEWKSTEIPMDQETYDIVGTRDAHMFRFDQAQSPPVFLYWLHSENSRKIGHPPELCYRGESYNITDRSEKQLSVNGRTIPVIQLFVQRGNYYLLVYYWYRIGGVETSSYLKQQIHWAWNQVKHLGLSNEGTEGEMIRISTQVDPNLPHDQAMSTAAERLQKWVTEEDSLNPQQSHL
jgi:EpsI family protein